MTNPLAARPGTRTYTVTFTEEQMWTIKTALEAEIEHAHDAARDGGDPVMETLEARYDLLWKQVMRELAK